jgi:hypothetical protein
VDGGAPWDWNDDRPVKRQRPRGSGMEANCERDDYGWGGYQMRLEFP